MLSIDQHV